MRVVEAIYENGMLKLQEPVVLEEGSLVKIYIYEIDPTTKGFIGDKTPAEIMAEIAALSNPVKPGDENASVEHDKYLYGSEKK